VTVFLVAAPPLLVGAVGLTHPIFLTPETAEQWRLGHLLLLPGFPLLAASLIVLLRGERGPAAWGARLLAAGYAVLYGALDSIAGLGAPQQVLRATERGEPAPPIGDLYEIGDRLGALGVYALMAAVVMTGGLLYARNRSPLAVLGAVVAVVASYAFLRHHVFPPRGVLAMVGLAAGFTLLELSRRGAPDRGAPGRGAPDLGQRRSANSSPGP